MLGATICPGLRSLLDLATAAGDLCGRGAIWGREGRFGLGRGIVFNSIKHFIQSQELLGNRMPRREITWLLALTGLSLIVLAMSGGFTPDITPDTAGYLNLGPFPGALAQPRVPLYGPLISLVDGGSGHFSLVPALQTAIFIGAAWFFVIELRRYGLSGLAVLSTAAALLFSNSLLLVGRWIHPELAAIASALLAFAGIVRLAGPKSRSWVILLVLASAGFAYLLRPSFLPLIIVLPALYAGLRAVRGERPFTAWVAIIFLAAALPFLSFAGVRALALGDFSIVSFGGYQMSGMATLMLSQGVVARLPEPDRPLGARLLAARKAAEESGRAIGVPLNSSNQRSFVSAALSYFDVYARTYDQMLGLIRAQRHPGENWVAFNRRMMGFSLAVVRTAPLRYAAWVVGASQRLLGHTVIANLPLMLAVIVILIAWPVRLLRYRTFRLSPAQPIDMPAMILLALAWLAAAGALTVLVTFPAIRYMDTANLLLAPIAIYWAVRMAVASWRPHQNNNIAQTRRPT